MLNKIILGFNLLFKIIILIILIQPLYGNSDCDSSCRVDNFNKNPTPENFNQLSNPTPEQFMKLESPTAENLEKLGSKATIDNFNRLEGFEKSDYIQKHFRERKDFFKSFLEKDLGLKIEKVDGFPKKFSAFPGEIVGNNNVKIDASIANNIPFRIDSNGNIIINNDLELETQRGEIEVYATSNNEMIYSVSKNAQVKIKSNKKIDGEFILKEGSSIIVPPNKFVNIKYNSINEIGAKKFRVFSKQKEVLVEFSSNNLLEKPLYEFFEDKNIENKIKFDAENNFQIRGTNFLTAINEKNYINVFSLSGEKTKKVFYNSRKINFMGRNIKYSVLPKNIDLIKETIENKNYFQINIDENGKMLQSDSVEFFNKKLLGVFQKEISYFKEDINKNYDYKFSNINFGNEINVKINRDLKRNTIDVVISGLIRGDVNNIDLSKIPSDFLPEILKKIVKEKMGFKDNVKLNSKFEFKNNNGDYEFVSKNSFIEILPLNEKGFTEITKEEFDQAVSNSKNFLSNLGGNYRFLERKNKKPIKSKTGQLSGFRISGIKIGETEKEVISFKVENKGERDIYYKYEGSAIYIPKGAKGEIKIIPKTDEEGKTKYEVNVDKDLIEVSKNIFGIEIKTKVRNLIFSTKEVCVDLEFIPKDFCQKLP